MAKRTLIVTEKSRVTSGTNDKGGEWTLWKLAATTEDGQPVKAELRSFADIAIGKPVEYELEKQDYKGAEQFMLKPPKKGGAALGPKVDELRARVENLEAEVAELKAAGGRPTASPVGAAADDDLPF